MTDQAESDIDALRTQIALKEAAVAELFVQLSGLHKRVKRAIERAEGGA